MEKPTADQIIASFDQIVDYVYGRRYGRDNPHITDQKTAETWIEQGLTLPIACAVFMRQLSVMHEHWLRQVDHTDRKNIPTTLKFFDEKIQTAIMKIEQKFENEYIDVEGEKWRNRIGFWLKGYAWYENLWGPVPGEPGCRAPSRLLAEMLPPVLPLKVGKKKNAG